MNQRTENANSTTASPQQLVSGDRASAWAEFERQCQKPDHRRIGNWMARRVARPLALRVTWIIAPWGISPHAATLLAMMLALAAAGLFAVGTVWSWIVAAVLFQLWYLVDHVDGQLARHARKETLDGAALDYLMHHLVNLAIPLGLGWGLFQATGNALWMLIGMMAAAGLLTIGLAHDVRYKAITKRLKRVRGALIVRGGTARPAPQPPLPRGWRLCAWLARKACEVHVVMNLLTIAAIAMWAFADERLFIGQLMLATLATLAVGVSGFDVLRAIRRQAAEQEFSAWYSPPEGAALELRDGWWHVVPIDGGPIDGERVSNERSETTSS